MRTVINGQRSGRCADLPIDRAFQLLADPYLSTMDELVHHFVAVTPLHQAFLPRQWSSPNRLP